MSEWYGVAEFKGRCEYVVKPILNIGSPRRYCAQPTDQYVTCTTCHFDGAQHFICPEHIERFLRMNVCLP